MAWIGVDARLPEPGRKVRVRGEYTPPGRGYPVAYRVDMGRGRWAWMSASWKGQSGVAYWWDDSGGLRLRDERQRDIPGIDRRPGPGP